MALLPFGSPPPKTNVAGAGITVVNSGATSTISLATTLPSQYIGTIQYYSANTNWSSNSTSWSNFSAISSISSTVVGTALSAPSSVVPGFVMSGGAGAYQITMNGDIYTQGSALGSEALVRISDGTNYSLSNAQISGSGGGSYSPDGSFVFLIYEPTSFTNLTFQLQGLAGSSSVNITPYATGLANAINNITFDVVYFPLAGAATGSGIVRSVTSVSTATTAGATAQTDYVYLVSGTTTLTLPTAVGNSNLYTVKNIGSNTVSIATTSSQTIDGSASPITLPVANTSLNLISDGSNWRIV